ncbi:MAG: stalled ribosome rescue protein Dom34 [Dokdonia sp.]|jgi:stalled ribosome rescue protein Dom34
MKNIGIWMDKRQALVLYLTNEVEKFKIITSEVEEYNAKGGSGSKLKGGPQDVVHDSKYLAHEKNQLRNYFSKITENIKDVDQLALFGPAETVDKFRKELKEKYKKLSSKVVVLKTVDSMTENQVKALIRDFFKNYK